MKNCIPTLLLSSVLALSGHAIAEQAESETQNPSAQGQMNPQQGMQEVRTDFEEDELKTFVEIQQDIGEVRNEYAQKIQSAQDREEAEELQGEARDSLIEIVETADLTVEEYNQIAHAYQMNPEVREKLNRMVQQ